MSHGIACMRARASKASYSTRGAWGDTPHKALMQIPRLTLWGVGAAPPQYKYDTLFIQQYITTMKKTHFVSQCIYIFCILMLVGACTKQEQAPAKQAKSKQVPQQQKGKSPAKPTNQGSKDYIHVQAKTLKPSRIHQKTSLGARLKSSSIIAIPTQTAGRITRIRVQEGAVVKKGTVLLYVDASRSGKNYRPSPIVSPIPGIVSNLPIKVGNKVASGATVASVVGTSAYKVEAAVPLNYAHVLGVGTRGILKLLSFPENSIPLVVHEISPKVNTSTSSVDISLVLDGDVDTSAFISGMYGKLELMLKTYEDQIVIERRAMVLKRDDKGKTVEGVFRIDEPDKQKSKVSFVPIKRGVEELDRLQVIDGLAQGDVIVIIGQTHLHHEDTVIVLERDGLRQTIAPAVFEE